MYQNVVMEKTHLTLYQKLQCLVNLPTILMMIVTTKEKNNTREKKLIDTIIFVFCLDIFQNKVFFKRLMPFFFQTVVDNLKYFEPSFDSLLKTFNGSSIIQNRISLDAFENQQKLLS